MTATKTRSKATALGRFDGTGEIQRLTQDDMGLVIEAVRYHGADGAENGMPTGQHKRIIRILCELYGIDPERRSEGL